MDISIFLPGMLDMAPHAESCSCDVAFPEPPAPTLASAPSVLGGLSSGAANRMLSGWDAAYLIAAVILGLGLLIAPLVTISHSLQVANHDLPSRSPGTPTVGCVALITGMVDCVWEGSGFRVRGSGTAYQKSSITNHKSPVHLGDRIALKSGLLEITYNTGAHVILQGPVNYDVESPTGGYLSVGKLTAKLEKKSEIRDQKSELTNQKSPDLCPLTSLLLGRPPRSSPTSAPSSASKSPRSNNAC